MRSNQEKIASNGYLLGMGREGRCVVTATKTPHPGGDGFALSHYRIEDPPGDWPDGPYTVTIDGQPMPVKRQNGFWLGG